MDDEWDVPSVTWTEDDWEAFFATGAADCSLCKQPLDDPRYVVALQLHCSWSPYAVRFNYAHVGCLRKAVPQII